MEAARRASRCAAGFIRTVRRGHARVAAGLAIDVPVLVLASDASGPDDVWHDALVTTDSVLDVADMKRLAPHCSVRT